MPPSSIVTIAGMDLRRRLICSGRLRDSLASGAGPSCLASRATSAADLAASRATSAADPPSAPPAPASLLCLELCGAGVCSSFDCPPVELARAANLSHPLWCGGARASSALRKKNKTLRDHCDALECMRIPKDKLHLELRPVERYLSILRSRLWRREKGFVPQGIACDTMCATQVSIQS